MKLYTNNIIKSQIYHTGMETKNLKVVIVGHSGVGKTSIINRYLFGSFDSNLQATTGAVFREKEHVLADKTKVLLQVWDTAGQERYRSIAKIYYKDAKVILAVYDVTSDQSFQQLKTWITEVKNNAAKNTRLIVIGNKIDLLSQKIQDSQSEVSYETAQSYCKSIGAELKLTSAKNSKGIEQLFDVVATKGHLVAEQIHQEVEQKRVNLHNIELQSKKQKSKCCI